MKSPTSSSTALPRVVLLPDHVFFVRVLPLAADTPAGDIVSQVELAIEAVSPFPLNQLFYGWWRPEGAPGVVVYAAYRKRFTSEQLDDWVDAELVMPAFAVALHDGAPGRTTSIPHAGGVTTIRWGDRGDLPEQISVVASTDTEAAGAPEVTGWAGSDAVAVSVAGESVELNLQACASRDIRDKEDLVARRRAASRDVMLWRIAQVAVVLLLLSGLAEIGLVVARGLEKSREQLVAEQEPKVDQLASQNSLALRIDELRTKRLLPFEMISAINDARPKTIQFLKTSTSGLYTLEVDAQTTMGTDVAVYKSKLSEMDSLKSVEVRDLSSNNALTKFTLLVTFKEGALHAGDAGQDAPPVEAPPADVPPGDTPPGGAPPPDMAPADAGPPAPPPVAGGATTINSRPGALQGAKEIQS